MREERVQAANLWTLIAPFLEEEPDKEVLYLSAAERRIYISFEPASEVEGSEVLPKNLKVDTRVLREENTRKEALEQLVKTLVPMMDKSPT